MPDQDSDVLVPKYDEAKDELPGSEAKLEPQPDWEPRYPGSGRLKDKVALITGADSGIGRAVAALFAREGADIAILYLCEHEDAEKTRQIVEAEGRRAITIAGDVGSKEFCEQAVKQTVDEFGKLDILVNNAGEQHWDKDIRDITEEQLRRTFQTNIFGMFFLVMIALSAVGLIVGGVGVVAIMMISVTERTREIGVRKALGATRLTILWQFLIEAVTLTGIGAVLGLVGGWMVAFLIRSGTSIEASIPPGAVVAALLASAVTGVLFGMIPAARAAKLDPVEALRHE